jgi:ribosomal protein S18 acetylase RimI-like enzyme
VLTNKQLKEIQVLQHECEANEPIKLKLNWDMLETRDKQEQNDFLYYEGGRLVGFLGLYGFGHQVEVCGMVAPEYRRKGIFTELYTKAQKEIKRRGFTDVLLNAPANSQSAKGYLHSVTCQYEFTEYQMKWEEVAIAADDAVSIRLAEPQDFEMEVQLDIQSFGFDEEEARDFNNRIKQEPLQFFYMIETGGRTVGKIRVSHMNGEAWIFGFSVFPECQGKGFGRKALTKVVLNEHQHGYPIFLDVEATNAHALKLYESCGFKAFQSQDYYRV